MLGHCQLQQQGLMPRHGCTYTLVTMHVRKVCWMVVHVPQTLQVHVDRQIEACNASGRHASMATFLCCEYRPDLMSENTHLKVNMVGCSQLGLLLRLLVLSVAGNKHLLRLKTCI